MTKQNMLRSKLDKMRYQIVESFHVEELRKQVEKVSKEEKTSKIKVARTNTDRVLSVLVVLYMGLIV